MVECTQMESIGIITLNRPEKRNAFNPELVAQVNKAMDKLNANPAIRAIIIRATGESFSAGADLSYIQSLRNNSYEENLGDSLRLAAMFESIYQSPKLTYSAVSGHALAGGCGLAMVTDFCLATENASFGFTETRIGFIPALVSVYLRYKLRAGDIRELLLSARIINAKEAIEIGMVNTLLDQTNFEAECLQHIERQISELSGDAVALTKELLRAQREQEHSAMLNTAAEFNARARSTADCIKGMDAFLNKTKISWND